jgi:hypothetical protein
MLLSDKDIRGILQELLYIKWMLLNLHS